MPDYKAIYDEIIAREENYNRPENSPGFLNCQQAHRELVNLSGRALDLGCGVGFVVEHLAGPEFWLEPWGADISEVAVTRARARVARKQVPASRVVQLVDQMLPFEASFFSLVTCFDMLEHLDEADVQTTVGEIQRVLRRGGVLFASVSCRPSGYDDQFGDNLHRTVRGLDWWVGELDPDRAEYDKHRNQFIMWKTCRKS
ncbi:MAG: class I SAM-dependent methyltransferase [Planctomycetaceae bacterium]|nr:class I SAM-dependent methyltransferase [Planctomycetaceae bacterium]